MEMCWKKLLSQRAGILVLEFETRLVSEVYDCVSEDASVVEVNLHVECKGCRREIMTLLSKDNITCKLYALVLSEKFQGGYSSEAKDFFHVSCKECHNVQKIFELTILIIKLDI